LRIIISSMTAVTGGITISLATDLQK